MINSALFWVTTDQHFQANQYISSYQETNPEEKSQLTQKRLLTAFYKH